MKNSYVTCTDMFCGAGGSSIGVVAAGAELKIGLNHWKLALETHAANFTHSEHVLTDIRTADPRRYPSTDVLIASPECTQHALAKGRKRKHMHQQDLWGTSAFDPAEERSRATMWDVPRFAEYHRYNIVIVENVVDSCLYWEPFDAWLLAMHSLGYEHELVFLNSMFAHPTPQSRDRLYVVFWRRGNRKPDLAICPPAWCAQCGADVEAVQAWKNQARRRGKYGARNQYLYCCPRCHGVVQPYYYCAANAIDWGIQGDRIGDRKIPLKPKTLERIRYGLAKYGRHPAFMASTNGDGAFVMGQERPGTPGRIYPVDGAMPTQTGWQDKALVKAPFLLGMHGASYAVRGMDEVTPTQVATGSTTALVTPPFLISPNHRSVRASGVADPFPTQTAQMNHGLLVPAGGTWNEEAKPLSKPYPTQTTREMYGLLLGQQSAAVARPLDQAAPTVSTAGAIGLVRAPAPFLLSFYGERHGTRGVDAALPTVPGWANHALIGSNRAHNLLRSVADELHTVVAGGGQHFLLVPSGRNGIAHPVDGPARTVATHECEALVRTAIDVEDCTFRMLAPHEIQAAMAFPAGYTVLGTARDRVRQLGNAVTPPVMSLLFARCVATLAG